MVDGDDWRWQPFVAVTNVSKGNRTMKEKRSFVPVAVAIVLLLLPVAYVGSYLALVEHGSALPYRSEAERTFFWPLEQIDRKLRPDAWGQCLPEPYYF